MPLGVYKIKRILPMLLLSTLTRTQNHEKFMRAL
jgi:hypothetical protein